MSILVILKEKGGRGVLAPKVKSLISIIFFYENTRCRLIYKPCFFLNKGGRGRRSKLLMTVLDENMGRS